MEAAMANDHFVNRATQLAVNDVEQSLVQASRDYENAMRSEDELLAADALKRYNTAKLEYDNLTGASQQQQQRQSGQLSVAQRNFLSRRAAGGDDLTAERMRDYALAHTRCVNAGLEVDSPQYFAAIERYADSMGDGRQPPLDERSAARIAGITDQEYAQQAQKFAQLKRAGHYQD
jgi:hypothetical protein